MYLIKEVSNINNEKEDFYIDQGKLNLGFNLFEAIMESIDDAFDATIGGDIFKVESQVRIYIYQETFKEIVNENELESSRYSYAILDNGPGTNVSGIFDFGKIKKERYPNRYALNNLNGIFHYGLVSHLNVANRLNFYSREWDKDWWLNSLEYNVFTRKAMSYIGKVTPFISDNVYVNDLNRSEFEVRTLVHVQGVRKSVLGADDLEELEIKLTKQLGITYRHYIEQGKKIFVNDKEVLPLDPFMQDYNFVELGVESELFHSFEISLTELLKVEEDEIVKKEILNDFKDLFEDESELLNQFITVNMYHLNLDLRKGEKKRLAGQEPNIIMPNGADSGFYIKRNLRYIGTAAKLLNICSNHNTFNYFRAEILFSPIFDGFFGIQVNKNKYDIKSSLGTLIVKKIEEKIGSLYTYMVNYKNNKDKGKLNNPVPIEVELKKQLEITKKRANYLVKTHAEAIDIGVQGELPKEAEDAIKILYEASEELLNKSNRLNELKGSCCNPTKEEVLVVEESAQQLISKVIILVQDAEEVLIRLESAISIRNEVLVESSKKLKQRISVALNSDRKILQTDDIVYKKGYQGFILEPLNEVQLYGVLLTMMQHYPNHFDFVLLDYSENDHLDCLVKVKKLELYNQLNLRERFENQWDDEWDNFLIENQGGFSFVELKYLLGDKKELGHSFTLVSHLICWDFSNNNINEFIAVDGKYKLSKDRKFLLHNDKRKKIKIICLKDFIEEMFSKEISSSQETLNMYLSI